MNPSKQEALFEIKRLKKEIQQAEWPALRAHYIERLARTQARVNEMSRNDSFFQTPRSPWKKLPQVKWEEVS